MRVMSACRHNIILPLIYIYIYIYIYIERERERERERGGGLDLWRCFVMKALADLDTYLSRQSHSITNRQTMSFRSLIRRPNDDRPKPIDMSVDSSPSHRRCTVLAVYERSLIKESIGSVTTRRLFGWFGDPPGPRPWIVRR